MPFKSIEADVVDADRSKKMKEIAAKKKNAVRLAVKAIKDKDIAKRQAKKTGKKSAKKATKKAGKKTSKHASMSHRNPATVLTQAKHFAAKDPRFLFFHYAKFSELVWRCAAYRTWEGLSLLDDSVWGHWFNPTRYRSLSPRLQRRAQCYATEILFRAAQAADPKLPLMAPFSQPTHIHLRLWDRFYGFMMEFGLDDLRAVELCCLVRAFSKYEQLSGISRDKASDVLRLVWKSCINNNLLPAMCSPQVPLMCGDFLVPFLMPRYSVSHLVAGAAGSALHTPPSPDRGTPLALNLPRSKLSALILFPEEVAKVSPGALLSVLGGETFTHTPGNAGAHAASLRIYYAASTQRASRVEEAVISEIARRALLQGFFSLGLMKTFSAKGPAVLQEAFGRASLYVFRIVFRRGGVAGAEPGAGEPGVLYPSEAADLLLRALPPAFRDTPPLLPRLGSGGVEGGRSGAAPPFGVAVMQVVTVLMLEAAVAVGGLGMEAYLALLAMLACMKDHVAQSATTHREVRCASAFLRRVVERVQDIDPSASSLDDFSGVVAGLFRVNSVRLQTLPEEQRRNSRRGAPKPTLKRLVPVMHRIHSALQSVREAECTDLLLLSGLGIAIGRLKSEEHAKFWAFFIRTVERNGLRDAGNAAMSNLARLHSAFVFWGKSDIDLMVFEELARRGESHLKNLPSGMLLHVGAEKIAGMESVILQRIKPASLNELMRLVHFAAAMPEVSAQLSAAFRRQDVTRLEPHQLAFLVSQASVLQWKDTRLLAKLQNAVQCSSFTPEGLSTVLRAFGKLSVSASLA